MRPMYDMLVRAANRASFHMPGHKGKPPFAAQDMYALDTTELPLTDDLYAPERGIAQAQQLYAQAAGAARTLLLANGSTSGIHVMTQLYCREGDMILLPRNAHLSAVNGCIMGGVKVCWLPLSMTADGLCAQPVPGAEGMPGVQRLTVAREALLQTWTLHDNGEERTLLTLAADGTLTLDRSASTLAASPDKHPIARTVPVADVNDVFIAVDGSAVEVMVNGKWLSGRIYPTK